jgi:hypothetical protein
MSTGAPDVAAWWYRRCGFVMFNLFCANSFLKG